MEPVDIQRDLSLFKNYAPLWANNTQDINAQEFKSGSTYLDYKKGENLYKFRKHKKKYCQLTKYCNRFYY